MEDSMSSGWWGNQEGGATARDPACRAATSAPPLISPPCPLTPDRQLSTRSNNPAPELAQLWFSYVLASVTADSTVNVIYNVTLLYPNRRVFYPLHLTGSITHARALPDT